MDSALFREFLFRPLGMAQAGIPWRPSHPAGGAPADRNRADPGGELTRPIARYARLRQVRLGRGARLHCSPVAGVSLLRLSPFLPLDLYASAGQFSAVRPAAGARIG